ncbi:hypothetical protein V7138_15070 [Bacillus sp. JJ1533]|uniref:hypothetical protein n=1 Tax=Bacillus sp. JJ1533 TaxID=3122959 RepID=UPI003000FAA5
MPRVKRQLRSQEEIRSLFESQGIKYVMINNKIMDLYQRGYFEYKVKTTDEKGNYIETDEVRKVKFDSRNLALYIGLKFLDKMEFWCYVDEIAAFMGMSVKRIKERLEELQEINLLMNNRLMKDGKNELLKEPMRFQLVKKHKDRGFERNRKVKTYRWYTPFDCELKEVTNPETKEVELKAHKYFMVSIYDLDLFINGILDEHEFALYLYLVQCYDSSDKESKGIAQTTSKIAENLNVKDVDVIQRRLDKLINLRVKDRFCLENEDLPLIHASKPKNFNHKLMTRQEPSLHYYPVYNDTTIQKIHNIEPDPYPVDEENKEDTNPNKLDIDLKVDSDLDNMDTHSNKMDANLLF